MQIHSVTFDSQEQDSTLVGIHTVLEDYQLAYFLNKFLLLKLNKSEDLLIKRKNVEFNFSFFEYQDEMLELEWYLVENSSVNQDKIGLFENFEKKDYLIPEKKKIDFFLKINGSYKRDVTTDINKIPQIITSYKIEINSLKSKKYLIL